MGELQHEFSGHILPTAQVLLGIVHEEIKKEGQVSYSSFLI